MTRAEFWMRDVFALPDSTIDQLSALAVAFTQDDLAKQGFCIDRLRPIDTQRRGSFWHFLIPIKRVVS